MISASTKLLHGVPHLHGPACAGARSFLVVRYPHTVGSYPLSTVRPPTGNLIVTGST